MRYSRTALLSAAALIAILPAQPADARRTVIDGGTSMALSGYCSPNSAGTSDCAPYTLPFSIQLGGTTYNSFWVNSNGTVSFQSIESFLAPQNSDTPPLPPLVLPDFGGIPIFSPAFATGPGFLPLDPSQGYDGAYVPKIAINTNGFTVDWFGCGDPMGCGQFTIDLITDAVFNQQEYDNFGLSFLIGLNSQLADPSSATPQENFDSGRQFLLDTFPNTFPIYTMTLSGLPNGFQVGFSYNPAATGDIGRYGVLVPGQYFETIGPLQDRTFRFTTGVPEPSTWMSLLLGFGLAGFALRRKRRLLATA
jgi:hypothetical protein